MILMMSHCGVELFCNEICATCLFLSVFLYYLRE